jgi:hypothetical protein
MILRVGAFFSSIRLNLAFRSADMMGEGDPFEDKTGMRVDWVDSWHTACI